MAIKDEIKYEWYLFRRAPIPFLITAIIFFWTGSWVVTELDATPIRTLREHADYLKDRLAQSNNELDQLQKKFAMTIQSEAPQLPPDFVTTLDASFSAGIFLIQRSNSEALAKHSFSGGAKSLNNSSGASAVVPIPPYMPNAGPPEQKSTAPEPQFHQEGQSD